MARDLTRNTSNRLELGSGAVIPLVAGAGAISVSVRFWADTLTGTLFQNSLVNIKRGDDPAHNAIYLAVHDGSAAVLHTSSNAAGTTQRTRNSTATFATGAWQTAGVVFDYASNTITPYVNGAASNGGSVATFGSATMQSGTVATAVDRIGAWGHSVGGQFDGAIAELAIWRRVLSAEEFLAVHRGLCPRLVWGGPPVVHFRCGGSLFDPLSGRTATIVGSVPERDHPPLARRWPRSAWRIPVLAPSGGGGPFRVVARRHYTAGAAAGKAFLSGAERGRLYVCGAEAGMAG